MNLWFLAGGLITGFAAVVHAIGGQLIDIRHLKESDIPSNEKIEFYGVWHLISGNFLIGTVTLLLLAITDFGESGIILALFISVNFLLYAITFLIISILEKQKQFFRVPQTFLLFLMGILPLLGIM